MLINRPGKVIFVEVLTEQLPLLPDSTTVTSAGLYKEVDKITGTVDIVTRNSNNTNSDLKTYKLHRGRVCCRVIVLDLITLPGTFVLSTSVRQNIILFFSLSWSICHRIAMEQKLKDAYLNKISNRNLCSVLSSVMCLRFMAQMVCRFFQS